MHAHRLQPAFVPADSDAPDGRATESNRRCGARMQGGQQSEAVRKALQLGTDAVREMKAKCEREQREAVRPHTPCTANVRPHTPCTANTPRAPPLGGVHC